ncbi:MAG: YraN family protein [Proteobacteria bacterium]|nr:YraN family protein [Pseudomonadota bacterium]
METGRTGERLAAEYLTERGFRIMATNYRFQRSEVDIIAFLPAARYEEGGELVVEIEELSNDEPMFEVKVKIGLAEPYQVFLLEPTKLVKEPEKRRDLDWYFEQYMYQPWLAGGDACAKAIVIYGQELFQMLFPKTEELDRASELREAINYARFDKTTFRIIGKTGNFHGILWESLFDPATHEPLLVKNVKFSRGSNSPARYLAHNNQFDSLNLLIVTSRDSWQGDVDYRGIQRPLIEAIIRSELNINFHVLRPGTFQSFTDHLEEVGAKHYHMVHFDLHGSVMDYEELMKEKKSGHLYFEPKAFKAEAFNKRYGVADMKPYDGFKSFLFFEKDETQQMVPYESEKLASTLESYQIPMCILNSCQSAKVIFDKGFKSLAQDFIEAGLQMVIAMRFSISVSAALIWVKTFYENLLGKGASPEQSASVASKQLYNNKSRDGFRDFKLDLEDWILPVLYSNGRIKMDLAPESRESRLERTRLTKEANQKDGNRYGFFGRDLEVLKVEKQLLLHKKLWIHGMIEVGKTSFLKELRRWWQISNFFDQVLYFSFEEETNSNTLFKAMIEALGFLYNSSKSGVDKYTFLKQELMLSDKKFVLIFDQMERFLHTDRYSPIAKLVRAVLDVPKLSIIFCGRGGSVPQFVQEVTEIKSLALEPLDETAAYALARSILATFNKDLEAVREEYPVKLAVLMDKLDGFPGTIESVIPRLNEMTVEELLNELDCFGE